MWQGPSAELHEVDVDVALVVVVVHLLHAILRRRQLDREGADYAT